MKKFETFKSEIVKRCKEKSACEPEFKRILASENFEQIAKVLTDNFNWSCVNGVIDAELIEPLNDILLSFNLCANTNVSGSTYCIASGSATVKAWGSATVEAWGSATVEASGSATVKAWGSATVEAWGSATVEASGSATVKAWGSATVKASGSATVEAWGSATVCSFNTIEHRLSDKAICRYYYQNKIKISKTTTIETY